MLKKELIENATARFLKEYPKLERKDNVAMSLHIGAKEIKETLYNYQLKENAELVECTIDDLFEQMEDDLVFLMPFEFDESFKNELCNEISQKYGFPLHKVHESFTWLCEWIPNTTEKPVIYKNVKEYLWIHGTYRYGGF